jgi:hypothetical protein
MITAQQLADAFARNLMIIHKQTQGLTHEDSLLQPDTRGNCLNWVLGHIAVNRVRLLDLLGEKSILRETETVRYKSGSEPITADGEGVLKLEALLEALEHAQDRVAAGLQRIALESFIAEKQVDGRSTTLGEQVLGFYFHETYHTGQTEFLRQLAGTDDKVI